MPIVLSEWCVVTSFYQSLQAMSLFYALFNLRKLLDIISVQNKKLTNAQQKMGESFLDSPIGPSVMIGSQKTQIYQRFADSRQEVFILKIQNDENNAAYVDSRRCFI